MGDFRYCDQYGLDKAARAARLALVGLGDTDGEIADLLSHTVIAPKVDEIVERFYEVLQENAIYARYLNRAHNLKRLRQAQTVYLLSLGQNFGSGEYFEERLRIGLAHARIGLPLHLFEYAFNHMRQLILDAIPEEIHADTRQYRRLLSFLLRITALDMSLVTETYHQTKITALQGSLDRLQLEDEELRYRIATDPLTEVASHSQMFSVLQRAIKLAKRTGSSLCVCMVDLDRFKRINDSYGHLVGDAVLRDVAARMEAAVRDFDTIGRYGGEEFVIILENTPVETAQEVIERVRRRVSDGPINVGGTSIEVTVSAGIAVLKPGDTAESIIERADNAMYGAKKAGRDRVIIEEVAV